MRVLSVSNTVVRTLPDSIHNALCVFDEQKGKQKGVMQRFECLKEVPYHYYLTPHNQPSCVEASTYRTHHNTVVLLGATPCNFVSFFLLLYLRCSFKIFVVQVYITQSVKLYFNFYLTTAPQTCNSTWFRASPECV